MGASVLLKYGHEHELDEETFRMLLAAAEFGHQYGIEKAEA